MINLISKTLDQNKRPPEINKKKKISYRETNDENKTVKEILNITKRKIRNETNFIKEARIQPSEEAFNSMKKNLQNKRPKNKNQIFQRINSENCHLKHIIKNLQKESLIIKKQNNELRKEQRKFRLQLRMETFETLQ